MGAGMKGRISANIVLMALACYFMLSCAESKANKRYGDALIALKADKLVVAENILKEIVAEFPDTKTAATARKQLIDLNAAKETFTVKEGKKFRTILEAHFADSMKYPKSVFEISTISKNFKIDDSVNIYYLPESGSDFKYRLFAAHKSSSALFIVTNEDRTFSRCDRNAEVLKNIESNSNTIKQSDNIFILEADGPQMADISSCVPLSR